MTAPRPSRIFLTGFSGSGKSAVAGLVAAALDWRALDTDDIIAGRAGRSIPDIFARDGEARFRELETEALPKPTGQLDEHERRSRLKPRRTQCSVAGGIPREKALSLDFHTAR